MLSKRINLQSQLTTLPLYQLANKINTDIALSNTKFIKIGFPELVDNDDTKNQLATAHWLNDVTDEEANACIYIIHSVIVVKGRLIAVLDLNSRYVSSEGNTLNDYEKWLNAHDLHAQYIYTNRRGEKTIDLSLPVRLNFIPCK
jgi:hypothetical protein